MGISSFFPILRFRLPGSVSSIAQKIQEAKGNKLSFSDPATYQKEACHCEEERSSDVAIPYGFRKIHGIATPLRPQARAKRNRRRRLLARRCEALVRDDVEYLTAAVNDNLSHNQGETE